MGSGWKRWALAIFASIILWPLAILRAETTLEGPEWTLEVIASNYPTPKELAQFLKRQIRFERDVELFGQLDYWQTPEELLARRAGDCEDYALLAKAILEQQGKEAFLLSLYGPDNYAHTVCAFVENGRYNVINKDRLVRYRAKSIEQIASFLCPGWRWGAIAEPSGRTGRSTRIFQNPSPASAPRNDFGNFPFY